jgi:cell division protein FtsB
MNHRVTHSNKYQEDNGGKELRIKGVYVVRFLVGFLLVLNILLLYAIGFSSHGLAGYKIQNDQVKELEDKILKLKDDNQKLFEMIQALKTDPKAQEKLVRQELGWVRENEVILEFPEKETDTRAKHEKPAKPVTPVK